MTSSNLIPSPVPVALSGQLVQVMQSSLVSDVDIAGLPFLLKPSQQDPLVKQITADVKDQFDSSKEAGENSFGTWWLRSQATFHGGQGQRYLDSNAGDDSLLRIRYSDSSYVYPHTSGELTIAGQVTSAPGTRAKCEQVTWSGVQKLVTIDTSTNGLIVEDLPTLANHTAITLGATGVVADITTDGANVYAAINNGVYRVAPGGTATLIHSGLSFTGTVTIGYAKQRLILAVGNVLYELDPNPVTPPVSSHTAHYTHPVPGYAYTCITEGTNGIYLAGFSGPNSDLASMTVTESGTTVVLGPPVVQLRMPPAERINSVLFYVGSIFALATSNGVRVGEFTPYGQPQAGSLNVIGKSPTSLSASGTLIWVGCADSIWWVDVSTQLDQSGLYATSQAAVGVGSTTNDPVTDLTVYPGAPDLVFGTTAAGRLVSQPSYQPSTPGTLTTSWVRFDTVESKRLHYITVEGSFPAVAGITDVCTVTVESDRGQTKTFVIEGGDATAYEFSIGSGLEPAQSYRLSFTLRDNGTGHGVTLRSWQMKALPVAQRFPELVYPLMLQDSERGAGRAERGYPGFAVERLLALLALASARTVVTVNDSIMDVAYQAVVDRIQFRQELPPTERNGLGGIVNVVLRAV